MVYVTVDSILDELSPNRKLRRRCEYFSGRRFASRLAANFFLESAYSLHPRGRVFADMRVETHGLRPATGL